MTQLNFYGVEGKKQYPDEIIQNMNEGTPSIILFWNILNISFWG